MKKHAKSKKDTKPLSSASVKKSRSPGEVTNVQLMDVLMHSTTVKTQLLPHILLSSPHCLHRVIAGVI